ncbi:MAG: tRNA (N(6)-L-threonylcarbamoyladenosine(37)-C(2))-methylthiotransferase MtaB [Clostridia bacterium]|nr:tRNA (N(6)-L-threonylcarbamoyladenosine(37)-C(2))-methylthiotransferase MtaB [Clostridia bacterium]
MTVAFFTLGCKTNQFESQAMEKLFSAKGWKVTAFDGDADVYVINSCTVTSTGDQKTRQCVRRTRRLHPNSFIAVCGCSARLHGEELLSLCGADLVSGNRDHEGFVGEIIRSVSERTEPHLFKESREDEFVRLPSGGLSERTRALLKVEDGCENFCTYCIIPYARGRVRCLPMKEALEDAESLCNEGYKEIVLTGIELSAYGEGLCELIVGLCGVMRGRARLSLGSLKPTTLTEDFCKRLSSLDNLCPHFHLSVQSGCDATLKRMNRHYTSDDVLAVAERLRRYFEGANITVDIITGFPGEDEAEFAATVEFIRCLRPGYAHVFPYSEREGTPAVRLSGSVEKKERERRAARISRIASESRLELLRSQIGRELNVLVERDGGGYTDNYIYTRIKGDVGQNELVRVRVTDTDGKELFAELI